MIIGNPLAGKTRTFHEAIKKIGDLLVVVPKDVQFNEKIEVPSQPGLRTVVFFDDIDRFIKGGRKDNLEKLIEAIIGSNAFIAATCRSGTEYLAFISSIHPDYRSLLQEIKIDKMSLKEEKAFFNFVAHHEVYGLDQTAFKEDHDRNIGSFFMGITEMKERFEKLEKMHIPQYIKTKKFDVPTKLPGTILTALACFYYAGKTVGNSAYEIEKIKDFCVRKSRWDCEDASGKFGALAHAFKKAGAGSFTHRHYEKIIQ